MAVMTLYDPFLSQWFNGRHRQGHRQGLRRYRQGPGERRDREGVQAYGFKVADVAEVFDTYKPFSETTNYRGQRVPLSVATVCRLSWICAGAPRGPNVHANRAGYGVIAGAFRKALGKAAD